MQHLHMSIIHTPDCNFCFRSWNGNQNGYAAYPSFLGVGSGADSPRASPGSPYSGGLTTAKCPSGWHAIGYTAAAYAAGGVNLLDVSSCSPRSVLQ